jgi:regulator of replication initiation timing
MDQLHTELFAIIGELTYRLRIIRSEQEEIQKLKDDVNDKTEKLQDIKQAYNDEISTVQRLLLENEALKAKVKKFEEKEAAERAMGFGRPVRQIGHDESPFDADESAILQSLNDAQIGGFYSENNFCKCDKYCSCLDQVSYGAPY